MDVHLPETQDFGEVAIVPIMAAALVVSDLGRGTAEDMSVPSQELSVKPEPEEPVIHKEAVHISSTSQEIPEVNVPVIEIEPESRPTNSTSEDKASTLEVEEQQVPEGHDPANIELNDDIPPAAAGPEPEVVAAVMAPVVGTFELQAQHSVEETTEVSFTPIPSVGSLVNCNKIIKEVHIAEAASETEFIALNEGRLGSAMEVLPTDFSSRINS